MKFRGFPALFDSVQEGNFDRTEGVPPTFLRLRRRHESQPHSPLWSKWGKQRIRANSEAPCCATALCKAPEGALPRQTDSKPAKGRQARKGLPPQPPHLRCVDVSVAVGLMATAARCIMEKARL